MNQASSVVVLDSDSRNGESTRRLASDLSIPVIGRMEDAGDRLVLVCGDDRLEICDAKSPPGRGFAVDFSTIDVRRGPGNLSRKQPLGRAIGRETEMVIDATAGFGHDSFLLAAMGFTVIAMERSPVVAALLEDGLRRAMKIPELAQAIGGRLTIVHADARAIIESMDSAPDSVYIDPMYPAKRKRSALAKKSIRLVRQLVGDDDDADRLAEAALAKAARRVVIKRPNHAEPLLPGPDLQFEGKLARYDVYLTPVRPAPADVNR